MSNEIIAIQYLRGIAATMVVVYHMLSPTTRIDYLDLPGLGRFGVEIFFVISGFIMWHTTATVNISPIDFWRRRILRIVPLYWFVLSVLIFGALLYPRLFHTTVITTENTIKSFLFIPHFHATQAGLIAPILIPGWSLNYEVFFYFIFGSVLFSASRALRFTFLISGLLSLVVLGWALKPTGALFSTYTNPDLIKFLDGVVLAIIYRNGWLNLPKLAALWLIAAGAAFLFVDPVSNLTKFNDLLGFSASSVVAGFLGLETIARRSPNSLLLALGNSSYSIYLSHLFFLRAMELIGQHFSIFGVSKALDGIYIVVALAASVIGGMSIHYFIERPIGVFCNRRRKTALGLELINHSASTIR